MAAISKPRPGTYTKAVALINNFKSSAPASSPHYPNITKIQIVREMNASIKMSALILQQHSANLCGPAAFFFSILQMRPDTYVQIGIDLYTKGKTMLGKLPLESSRRAKNHIPAQIRDVDWMMFTSIKPSYGTPDDLFEPVKGITWAGDMKDWAQQAGFSSVEDQTKYSTLPPSVAIKKLLEAQTAFNAGYTVYLLVDSDIFREFKVKTGLSMPNHWVLLNSSIQVQRYNEKFKSYGAKSVINQSLADSMMKEASSKKEKAEFDADIYENEEEPIEMKDRVYMEAFTWGKTNAKVHSRISATHVAQLEYLIRGYYGYIKAMY